MARATCLGQEENGQLSQYVFSPHSEIHKPLEDQSHPEVFNRKVEFN